MAEPLLSGVYPEIDMAAVALDRADGVLEVLGRTPAGPAGEISVALGDGSVWVVDHADPERLVRLEIAAADPARSPLLIVAAGGENALRIADTAAHAHDEARLRPLSTAPRGWEALMVGRVLLQLDLAADDDLSPLARLAALATVVDETEAAPVGSLFRRTVAGGLQLAPELAAAAMEDLGVRRGEVLGFPPGVLWELSEELHRLTDRLESQGLPRGPVEDLAGLLRRTADTLWDPPVAALIRDGAPAEEPSAPSAPMVSEERAVRPGPPWLEIVVAGHGVVHAPGASRGSWAVVLRADGLAPLARVPLRPAGPTELVAPVVLPPDVGPSDAVVRVLSEEEARLPPRTSPGLDAVRRAVRAGRLAARIARALGPHEAAPQWDECARRWAEAGDHSRAKLAGSRITHGRGRQAPPRDRFTRARPGGRGTGPGLLADAVAVSLDDV